MAENHKAYMHPTFPSAKDNEHSDHLRREHTVTHQDGGIRKRTEAHSVDGGGSGTMQMGVGGRGTV